MITWSDVDVRARGLATRLVGRTRLVALANAADLEAVAGGIGAVGYPVRDVVPRISPGQIELAVRRGAGQRLELLARWAGARSRALVVIFEDEDRRSLRAILRGALQGTTAESRLAGLIPTPGLSERALQALARLETTREIATLLIAWRNPYGDAIRGETEERRPDAFLLELAIDRTFAARARRAARRGGRILQAHVSRVIDLENAFSALLLAGGQHDVDPKQCLLEGGAELEASAFHQAARAAGRRECARVLSRALASPFSEVIQAHASSIERLEAAVLAAQIQSLRKHARLDPLSAAPLLKYVLCLRAEVIDLRRIIWGVSLAVPAESIHAGLVTDR